MLCSLPMFAALKKKFPNSKITLVLSPVFYQINFKELNPYADEILFYAKDRLFDIFKFYKKLREKKIDIAIVPSSVKLSNTSHIIGFLSGAKYRVGANCINGKHNKMSFLLNVKSDLNWKQLHQIQKNLRIAGMLGCELSENEIKSIQYKISDEDKAFGEEFVNRNFPDKRRMIIAFHAGAGDSYRAWKTENFIQLIKRLHNTYKCYVFTAPGEIDKEITETLKNSEDLKQINPVIAENLPLGKLSAVLKKVKLFITNNTGTLHLAHFTGITSLALFTALQVNDWAYNSETESCVSAENINDITIEQVFEKCCGMID
jgi:ADP-heptose:LPS heptosyltransferase